MMEGVSPFFSSQGLSISDSLPMIHINCDQAFVNMEHLIERETIKDLLRDCPEVNYVTVEDMANLPGIPKRTLHLLFERLSSENRQSARAILRKLMPTPIRIGNEVISLSPLIWSLYSTKNLDHLDLSLMIPLEAIKIIDQMFWQEKIQFSSDPKELLALFNGLSILKISAFDSLLIEAFHLASKAIKKTDPLFLLCLASLSSLNDSDFVDEHVSFWLNKADTSDELMMRIRQLKEGLVIIKSLVLEGPVVNDKVVQAVRQNFPLLRNLSLINCNLSNAAGMDIVELNQLHQLHISDCLAISSEIGWWISQLPQLRILKLNNCKYIDSKFFDSFREQHPLEVLTPCRSMTDLSFLKKFTQLRDLTIHAIFSADLKNLTQLTKLSIYNCNIGKFDLLKDFKLLTELRLLHCVVNESCLPNSLECLRLDGTSFLSKNFDFLANLTRLKKLGMTDCKLLEDGNWVSLQDAASPSIGKLKMLEELVFSNNQLTDKSIPFLKKLRQLKSLDITLSNITQFEWAKSIGLSTFLRDK